MISKRLINHLSFVGAGMGALFWILEALIHCMLFTNNSLSQQIFLPDLHEIWMRILVWILLIIFGGYAQILINRRKQAEEKTMLAYSELDQIFNTAADGMRIIDKDFNVLRINETFSALAGIGKDKAIGQKCYKVFHGSLCHTPRCPLNRIFQGEGRVESDVEKERSDGLLIPCIVTATPFRSGKGELIGIVEDFKNITERKRVEMEREILNKNLMNSNKRLKELVVTDSHTGLYNHRYLAEALDIALYRFRKFNHPFSVIMLDLDYFKAINDVYGHQFGDIVLKQLAGQLTRAVRRQDLVIRFGGEEFIIISPGINKAAALTLAQRLIDSIRLYNFGNEKHIINLKASLAVASYPEDKLSEDTDLVKFADQILSKAKIDGGNRIYSAVNIEKERGAEDIEENKEIKFLKEKLQKLVKRANQSLLEAIFAFAKTIKLKDYYTVEQAETAIYYATQIARALILSDEEIEQVRQAAILHDLGKIGIDTEILLKKSELTSEEFKQVKRHTQIGMDVIKPIQLLQSINFLILYHHERWDGTGYPAGLKGEDIPVGARIVAVADVYQALISHRPYRPAYSKDAAREIIEKGSGTQFDPKIVNAFLKL